MTEKENLHLWHVILFASYTPIPPISVAHSYFDVTAAEQTEGGEK